MAGLQTSSEAPPTRGSWAVVAMVAGIAGLAVGLAFLYVFVLEDRIRLQSLGYVEFTPPGGPSTPFVVPPVVRPDVVPALRAALSDDAEVIGVEVEDKARAFLVRAFNSPFHHVVNDVVGETPVSFAYCDMRGCMKVFSGSEKGRPLDLALVGMLEGRMIIRAGAGVYFQENCQPATPDAPAFPFTEFACVRTTWKAWRDAHPHTEIYIGVEHEPLTPHTATTSPRPDAR